MAAPGHDAAESNADADADRDAHAHSDGFMRDA
jgi:hypothetical protein